MKTQTKQLWTVIGYIVLIIASGYFVVNYFFIDTLDTINYIGIDVCGIVWAALILKWVMQKIKMQF